jgi:uncharacterized protein YaiE (UPF0345 family)
VAIATFTMKKNAGIGVNLNAIYRPGTGEREQMRIWGATETSQQ